MKPTRYEQQQRKHYGNIQGDSWLMKGTAGDDFLGFCDHKNSHKHVSDSILQ